MIKLNCLLRVICSEFSSRTSKGDSYHLEIDVKVFNLSVSAFWIWSALRNDDYEVGILPSVMQTNLVHFIRGVGHHWSIFIGKNLLIPYERKMVMIQYNISDIPGGTQSILLSSFSKLCVQSLLLTKCSRYVRLWYSNSLSTALYGQRRKWTIYVTLDLFFLIYFRQSEYSAYGAMQHMLTLTFNF